MTSRLRDRRAALTAVLYLAALLVTAVWSPPRRVGDGGEYFVMARQLASARPPSLSADDLREVKTDLAALGAGFESALLDYPDLIASDGRQEFLHFFLYPLLVAPVVPVVSAVGLHPNWAFTIANALMLAGAFFVVARFAPLTACVAGFVSPIIWWVDKAHTEAFLFATVTIAAVVAGARPALALVMFALAGAQNAALGITYPVFALLIYLATRRTVFRPRTWIAAAAGAAIVAAPFLYTWVRLGRWSPMAEYAQRVVPTVGGLAAFVLEPNIGILPHAPVYGLAVAAAFVLAVRSLMRRTSMPAFWWWPAIIQLLLLLAWSQNPNANHGGTPGMNRWVLSLLALSLPWIALARERSPTGARLFVNLFVAISAILTAAASLPARPERYMEATGFAQRLWSLGIVHVTPAEVFAERVQGREPAFAPTHDGSCHILLLSHEQSPPQCAPPVDPLPAWCRGTGAMCYAVVERERVRYVPAPQNGFYYQVAAPSWPASGPLASNVRQLLQEVDPTARVWRVDNPRRWRDRFPGVEIAMVVRSAKVAVMYVARASEDGYRVLAAQGDTIVPLLPSSERTNLAVVMRP